MDKNLILLLGIIALWFLVIRNLKKGKTENKSETHESENGNTHGGGGGSFANDDIQFTNTSAGNVETTGRSYTL